MTTTDYIIVGAGVLGLSVAYHLRGQGYRVSVLERDAATGMHASGKNAGMIRHLYRHPQLTAWTATTLATLPPELEAHFRQTGSLIIGRRAPSHSSELFTERSVTLKGRPFSAVHCQADGLLDSPQFMESLSHLCNEKEVDIRLSSATQKIVSSDGIFTVTAGREILQAPRVIVCAGAWANLLESQLGITIDVKAFARHLYSVSELELDGELDTQLGFWWNEDDSWYLRRWSEGRYLLSTCNEVATNPDSYVPHFETTDQLQLRLGRTFEVVDRWHCFRTYAPDLLPVIGEDPRLSGLFWFSGFGGFGMSTGFGAAHSFTQYLSGDLAAIPEQFLPARVC